MKYDKNTDIVVVTLFEKKSLFDVSSRDRAPKRFKYAEAVSGTIDPVYRDEDEKELIKRARRAWKQAAGMPATSIDKYADVSYYASISSIDFK